MGLQIKIRVHLRSVVQQYLVHGDSVGAEMFGALNQLDGRKDAAQPVHHRLGVSIHHYGFDFRHSEESLNNVMKKGFARKRAVIFTRHALAVVTHGDEGGEFHAPYFILQRLAHHHVCDFVADGLI